MSVLEILPANSEVDVDVDETAIFAKNKFFERPYQDEVVNPSRKLLRGTASLANMRCKVVNELEGYLHDDMGPVDEKTAPVQPRVHKN